MYLRFTARRRAAKCALIAFAPPATPTSRRRAFAARVAPSAVVGEEVAPPRPRRSPPPACPPAVEAPGDEVEQPAPRPRGAAPPRGSPPRSRRTRRAWAWQAMKPEVAGPMSLTRADAVAPQPRASVWRAADGLDPRPRTRSSKPKERSMNSMVVVDRLGHARPRRWPGRGRGDLSGYRECAAHRAVAADDEEDVDVLLDQRVDHLGRILHAARGAEHRAAEAMHVRHPPRDRACSARVPVARASGPRSRSGSRGCRVRRSPGSARRRFRARRCFRPGHRPPQVDDAAGGCAADRRRCGLRGAGELETRGSFGDEPSVWCRGSRADRRAATLSASPT